MGKPQRERGGGSDFDDYGFILYLNSVVCHGMRLYQERHTLSALSNTVGYK